MKLHFNPIRAFRNFFIARAAKANRALMDADSPALADPHANDFYGLVDGKPMTYREFNDHLAEHFAALSEKSDNLATSAAAAPRLAE